MTIEAKLQALTEALARVEKRAQAAEDYIAISNLQRTYGYYVDKFQWEQVADLFARDAIIEINARGKFKGHERIREYMRHFGPAQRGVLMNHIQLQPVIHIDEDGETAHGRWRAMMQVGELGGVARLGEAIYENRYIKEDGVWKIAYRSELVDWVREEAAADAWFSGSKMIIGARKPNDPLYDRAVMKETS